tara:strand:- start:2511 stop:3068 length:558 start_codon:yes stop_codon:yes gene_type:complete
MNMMKLFLKEENVRFAIKLTIAAGFVLSLLFLWDIYNTKEAIQEKQSIIQDFEDSQTDLKVIQAKTTDSIVVLTDSLAKLNVFSSWIDVAHWVENNRTITEQNMLGYQYEIAPLILHPKGHKTTQEVNINYQLNFFNQDFTSLLTFLQASTEDSTKSLFIKSLIVNADTAGVTQSIVTLGGWIRQ